MKYLFIPLIFLLSACANKPIQPEQIVVTKTEYVMRIPPAKLTTLPDKPASINVDDPNLKQSDVSKFMKNSEDYTIQLENQLIEIAKFFIDERAKLDTKENAK